MRICAAWLLKHVAATRSMMYGKPSIFMSGRCSLTPILRSLGRGFLVAHAFLYFDPRDHHCRSPRCG